MLFLYCSVNQSLRPHFSPLTQKKKKKQAHLYFLPLDRQQRTLWIQSCANLARHTERFLNPLDLLNTSCW